MKFRRKNKTNTKKRQRAYIVSKDSWGRKTHKKDLIFELVKKELVY